MPIAPGTPARASVSAYIPCYNNERTLAAAIDGIRKQTITVDDFFIVDDGSTDASREIATGLGVRVVQMDFNLGRGAVRARAMEEARHELVVCCDATNRLQEDFLEKAVPWFDDAKVAGVSGHLVDLNITGPVGRWRARHLFHQYDGWTEPRRDTLSTWGTLMRKSAVMSVGNYDRRLRAVEDRELGGRLEAAGYGIYFDPKLIVATQVRNPLGKVMERYFRWYWDGQDRVTPKDFFHAQVNAFKILARDDLKAGDPGAALISLLTPYYQVLHYHPIESWSMVSFWRKLTTKPVWWWERNRRYPIRSEWDCLPPIRGDQGTVPFVVLTMMHNFDDALWCAWSWMRFLAPEVRLEIHIDGSFGDRERAAVEKIFPGARLIDCRELVAEAAGPYPVLKEFFAEYPIGRKMAILLHRQRTGKVLYCDFDVLAFTSPVEVLECIRNGVSGAYFQEEFDGVFDPLILERAAKLGLKPLETFNAGFMVLQQDSISLEETNALLQKWRDCKTWFAEQTSFACLLQKVPMMALPRERYVLSGVRQFYWQKDVDYREIAGRHFVTPTRHVMYMTALPLLKKDAAKMAARTS